MGERVKGRKKQMMNRGNGASGNRRKNKTVFLRVSAPPREAPLAPSRSGSRVSRPPQLQRRDQSYLEGMNVMPRMAPHAAAQLRRKATVGFLVQRSAWATEGGEMPSSGVASAVLAGAQVVVPLAALIDIEAERGKLGGQLKEAEAEIARLEGKLRDGQFLSKAPDAVVAKEREKLGAAQSRAEGLRGRLAELG